MTSLIIRQDATLSATIPAEALALKEEALASGALIGRVTNANENRDAVEAQVKLRALITGVEKCRKEVKEPVLMLCKAIDETAKTFTKELIEEAGRVGALVSDFAALELMKQRAAQARANAELTALEKEREAELAKATNHDEADAITERYSQLAQQTSVAIAPTPRADGQRVAEEWSIVVSDVHLLYRHYPNAVELKPRLTEIKALLNAGVKVQGVTATKLVKATVRVSKQETIQI